MKNIDFRLFASVIAEGYGIRNKLLIAFYFAARMIGNAAGKKLFSQLPYPVTIKNQDGIYHCGNNFSNLWAVSFRSEINIRKFFTPCRMFVDVGAHIGKYTVMMAKRCKKVISIEPSPDNFRVLQANIRMNKLRNVQALNIACYSRKAKKRLYLSNWSGMNSFYPTW